MTSLLWPVRGLFLHVLKAGRASIHPSALAAGVSNAFSQAFPAPSARQEDLVTPPPQSLTAFREMGQEEFCGDRAFYFISFHKHNEKKKNPANRIANSAGLGKLFIPSKHKASWHTLRLMTSQEQ